jgi:hypothetical protein
MKKASHHRFQILTKRADRLAELDKGKFRLAPATGQFLPLHEEQKHLSLPFV